MFKCGDKVAAVREHHGLTLGEVYTVSHRAGNGWGDSQVFIEESYLSYPAKSFQIVNPLDVLIERLNED